MIQKKWTILIMCCVLPAIAGGLEKKLLKAVLAGDFAQARALIEKGADVNHTIRGKESLLMCAVDQGDLDMTELLLDKGADLSHQSKSGETALYRASQAGRLVIADTLIARGIDINATTDKEISPLHLAVGRRDYAMMRLLLDQGANPAQADDAGWTPLHIAAGQKNPLFLETLLAVGAPVDAVDHNGTTPLMIAAQSHRFESVSRLLQYGADPNIKDVDGNVAVNYVAGWHKELRALLEKKDHPSTDPIAHRQKLELPVLEKLVAKGFNVNATDENGLTLLFKVVENAGLPELEYIIAQGANVNHADKEGVTPLMIAALAGRVTQTKVLLKHGADPNVMSQHGFTALYLAGLRDDEPLARQLMAGGASNVAKINDHHVELPGKGRYYRLRRQIGWLPDLTETSFVGRKYFDNIMPEEREPVIEFSKNKDKDIEPPVFTKKVAPRYPEEALRYHLQGYVIIQAVLRKDGTMDSFHVMRPLGNGRYGFEEAAIECMKQWQFKPGKKAGKPVDIRMTLKLDFVLQGVRRR